MNTRILLTVAALGAAGASYWAGTRVHTPAAGIPDCCVAGGIKVSSAGNDNSSAASLPGSAPALSPKSLYQLKADWTDDSGATRALASLRGEPVVMAMIFTNCEYACPIIVGDLLRIREALPEKDRARTRFVLVSFDSTRDTPAALAAYRKKMNLEAPAWTLLRGEPTDVQELAMLLGVKYKQDARGEFSHSNTITVLNPEGEIAFQREGLRGDSDQVARAVAATAK